MRELTVRIRFTKPSLGNAKKDNTGRFVFVRNPNGLVSFLSTWHHANMRFASQILGRHQDEVRKILWDINVDGVVAKDGWYRRYYTVSGTSKQRYVRHESFKVGQVVGLNCVLPPAISDDDFWQLMHLAGLYRGLSPARPGEFGHYEVVSIRPRRAVREADATVEEQEEGNDQAPQAMPKLAGLGDGESQSRCAADA